MSIQDEQVEVDPETQLTHVWSRNPPLIGPGVSHSPKFAIQSTVQESKRPYKTYKTYKIHLQIQTILQVKMATLILRSESKHAERRSARESPTMQTRTDTDQQSPRPPSKPCYTMATGSKSNAARTDATRMTSSKLWVPSWSRKAHGRQPRQTIS